MTPDEFRRHGHAVVDWLADYQERIRDLPVEARTAPGEVKALLPASPPQEAEPFEAVLADLDRVVLPHLSLWQHPAFFGYFPANALPAGILADMVSTGLGVIGLSWQSSPAVTEVEEVVVDWFRQMAGLSADWFGVIQDTASTATLVALLCARERSTGCAFDRGGLQGNEGRGIDGRGDDGPLVVYTSASAHSSVAKAALLAGIGRDHVRMVPVDEAFAMRPEALAAAIREDRAAGRRPCAVVAAVGGTATTSMDPVAQIAAIAGAEGIWLHVDAAMAGSAMILPECRWMWDGIEGADSLVVNAHKWLGVPFDCSLYFVRDEPHLLKVMSTNPSFLQSAVDDRVRNLRDTSIPLGRRFRALKLWFVIREQGVAGLQARLRRDLQMARDLAARIAAAPHWRIVAPVVLQTVCIRYEPPLVPAESLDDFTRDWAAAVNATGRAYLTPSTAGDAWMVRISIGAHTTGPSDVAALWELVQAVAAERAEAYAA